MTAGGSGSSATERHRCGTFASLTRWGGMKLAALTLLITAALATPAGAAAWHSYGLFIRNAPVEGGSGTHSARLTRSVAVS